MLGVAMITDPFGRLSGNDDIAKPQLTSRAIDNNIPNDLTSKLIGLAICAPNVLALAGEIKCPSHYIVDTELIYSDYHASHQRPSINDADHGVYLFLSRCHQRRVSRAH